MWFGNTFYSNSVAEQVFWKILWWNLFFFLFFLPRKETGIYCRWSDAGFYFCTAFFLTCLRGSHGLTLGHLSHILFYKQWWQYTKKGFKRDLSVFKQWIVHLVQTVFTHRFKSTVACSPYNNPFNLVDVINSIKYLKFLLSFKIIHSVVR